MSSPDLHAVAIYNETGRAAAEVLGLFKAGTGAISELLRLGLTERGYGCRDSTGAHGSGVHSHPRNPDDRVRELQELLRRQVADLWEDKATVMAHYTDSERIGILTGLHDGVGGLLMVPILLGEERAVHVFVPGQDYSLRKAPYVLTRVPDHLLEPGRIQAVSRSQETACIYGTLQKAFPLHVIVSAEEYAEVTGKECVHEGFVLASPDGDRADADDSGLVPNRR